MPTFYSGHWAGQGQSTCHVYSVDGTGQDQTLSQQSKLELSGGEM